jgi:hypothetical protein
VSKFVKTNEIRAAVKNREIEVLDALGIEWRKGRPHIDCPYPSHGGASDWRWDAKTAKAQCTCTKGDGIFDVLKRRGVLFMTSFEVMDRDLRVLKVFGHLTSDDPAAVGKDEVGDALGSLLDGLANRFGVFGAGSDTPAKGGA